MDKWTSYCDNYSTYSFNNARRNLSVECINETDDSVEIYTQQGTSIPNNWYTTVGVSPKKSLSIGCGISCIFKLSPNMFFGDMNGYNGAISFSFSNKPLVGYDMVPSNLHYTIYDSKNNIYHNLPQNKKGGGYGPSLFSLNDICGFTLTLFPDEGVCNATTSIPTNSLTANTLRVSYFKMCVKKNIQDSVPIVLEGYLPKSFNLGVETSLSINFQYDKLFIYLNSMQIVSVDVADENNYKDDLYYDLFTLIDNCNFTMSVMGAWNSPVHFKIINI